MKATVGSNAGHLLRPKARAQWSSDLLSLSGGQLDCGEGRHDLASLRLLTNHVRVAAPIRSPETGPIHRRDSFLSREAHNIWDLDLAFRHGRHRRLGARRRRKRHTDVRLALALVCFTRRREHEEDDYYCPAHVNRVRLPWRDVKRLWAGGRRGIGNHEPASVPGLGGTTSSRPNNRWPVAPAA